METQQSQPDTPVWVAIQSFIPLFLWAILFVLLLRFFRALEVVLLGLLAAGAMASLLHPIVRILPGPRGLRAIMAVMAFLLVVITIVGLAAWQLYQPIAENLRQWPQIEEGANSVLRKISIRLGLEDLLTVRDLAGRVGSLLTGSAVSDWIGGLASALLGLLLAVLVAFIGGLYLLATTPERLLEPALGILPPNRQPPMRNAIRDLEPRLRAWFLGMVVGMATVGVTTGLGYWFIGLNFALGLALFATVAETVPTFGPFLTLVLALLVAASQGTTQVIGVLIVYAIVQALESYVLTPLIMREAAHIPPIISLLSILLWGNIFGLPGLILAIPIDLTIWTMLKHYIVLPHRRAAAEMLPS